MRALSPAIWRTLLAGALLGLVILGVGGRLAMAAVTAMAGGTPTFTVGGTLTVVALGGVSGLAGAVFAIVSQALVRRLLPGAIWARYVLFTFLLLLVTIRGLRGTQQPGAEYFYALVALYGLALAWTTRAPASTATGAGDVR